MTGRQRLIQLTDQQITVLTRVAWGWSFPAISNDIGESVRDARLIHRSTLQRLGADNAPHAVALAIGLGLIPDDVATNPTLPGGSRVR